jgi:beta-propeller repeat-containing protein
VRIQALSAFAIVGLLASAVLVDRAPVRVPVAQITGRSAGDNAASGAAAIARSYATLPLSFEANRGQTDPSVDFLVRGVGYTLFLSADETVVSLRPAASRDATPAVLRMKIVGGDRAAAADVRNALPGVVNYFTGAKPAGWKIGIPTYGRVLYSDIYPNVDLAYYGDQGRLEYDFVAKPGADLASIALRFDGADDIALDEDGNLVVSVGDRAVTQMRPLAYQTIDGKRLPVPASYALGSDRTIRFDLGSHDRTLPLIIDPVLAYSTFLGGSNLENGTSITVDSFGNAYIAGDATSSDFPTTVGAFQTTLLGSVDVFVTKLSLLGNALIYSTYLGGSADDVGRGIALDASGAVYVTGQTRSTDFPTTFGAFQSSYAGGRDAFVTKLDPQGSALLFSTYLGGGDEETGLGVARTPSGSAVVTGYTNSANFPTTLGAFQTSKADRADVFVAMLNVLGTGLVYCTYLGGSQDEFGTDVTVDASGNAYLAISTVSSDYPTTAGSFQPVSGGLFDAAVTKLNPLGTGLVYSTYLGGSLTDSGEGIAVDAAGNAYLAGYSRSTNYPTTAGAFQTANAGNYDGVLTKLNPLGNALVYSTYLGGSNDDQAFAIAIDASGSAYLTGFTFSSNDFPTLSAFQTAKAGSFDAFVTKLNAAGAALDYSSYLGGSAEEFGNGIAVDVTGNAYVTGLTGSSDFPTTVAAFQPVSGGNSDAFVAKVGLLGSTPLCTVNVNEGGWITAANGDMATFNGIVMTDAQNNLSGHEKYMDHGPVQAMDVDSIEILATTCSDDRTTASIFGRATIDGSGDHLFRIDMVDRSQSGGDDRYGISLDNGYNSGLQPLGGGNIVIH